VDFPLKTDHAFFVLFVQTKSLTTNDCAFSAPHKKRAIRKLLRGILLSLFLFFTTLKIDKTKAIKIAAVTIKSE